MEGVGGSNKLPRGSVDLVRAKKGSESAKQNAPARTRIKMRALWPAQPQQRLPIRNYLLCESSEARENMCAELSRQIGERVNLQQ
jgi:hypothetical protein